MDTVFNEHLPLEKAATLTSQFYTDSEYFQKELEKVFYRGWNYVGRASQIPEPGQWMTAQIGKVPLVLTHDFDGKIYGVLNVCRHRAAKVCRGIQGQGSRLKCQYHGWSYDLRGHLMTTPEFAGVENFEKQDHSLPRFQVKRLHDWLFISLSLSPPSFEEQWQSFEHLAAPFEVSKMQFWKRVEYSLQCNWKVFVDNYLDGGYHISTLHPSLAGLIPPSEYESHLFAASSVQTAPLKDKVTSELISQVRKGKAQYWWLYPNLMINLYDGVMDVNLVLPESSNRCKVIFDFYFSDISQSKHLLLDESLRLAHQIQEEDQEICEEVQLGLESGFFSQGRFSVSREKTGYQFHQLLFQDLKRDLK